MNKITTFLMSLSVFFLSSPLFAEDGDAMPPREQGLSQTFIMIAIALVFFYFILWRPEQKKRKALDDQRNALKKGDRVTAMGIIGTVVKLQGQTVILKMYDGSKIEVVIGAINEVLPASDEEAKRADKDDKPATGKRAEIEHLEQ